MFEIFNCIYYLNLGYNFIAGTCIIVYFLINKMKINSLKEFCWILFLPIVGLGKWYYNNSPVESQREIVYPEKWYIYKYMIKLNIGFIIFIIATSIITIIYLTCFIGSGLDWADSQDNTLAISFGLLFDFGYLILFSIILGGILTWLVISYIVLIVLPKNAMKNIENKLIIDKLYKNKELDNID